MKAPTSGRMRTVELGWFCLATFLPAMVVTYGQDAAPSSLVNSVLTVTVTGGRAPFATNGSWRLFSSVTGTNYLALGPGPLSAGNYAYTKAGPAAGTAVLADAAAGPPITLQLLFVSPSAGMLALSNAAGFQTGSFTVTPFVDASPPALFLPGVVDGQFQSYLSGQAGFVYAIETSTDLAHWQGWREVSLTDLTTNVTDTMARAGCFYRAGLAATAFAPGEITNQTFNLTITQGAAPLATGGICQWLASPTDNGYQVMGGPGTTSSSGHYSYTRTGPNSGLISWQDSRVGSVTEQLVFASPQSGWFYLTNAAGFEAGRFTVADGPVEFLGNVQFTLDSARAGSLYFAADGSSARLSVTNGAGWIWTLLFPADALLAPRSIGMTPFADTDASASLLPVAAGVRFSPDGLQLSDSVTLTVTPPAPLGPHAGLMLAAGDGSNLQLASTFNQGGTYSTTLFHFSSAAATDPSEQQWDDFLKSHLPQVEAAYANAVKYAKSLERVIVMPPEPPDYNWTCDPDDKTLADYFVDNYQKLLFDKETEALGRVLSSAKELELASQEVSPDAGSVARELIETAMYRKVDLLFAQYSKNPSKFGSVAGVALSVSRQDELVGGAGRADWGQQLQSWGLRVEDYYFKQLRDQHVYSKAAALVQIQVAVALLGGESDPTDLFNRLAAALSFQLTWDMNFTQSQGSTDTVLDQVGVEAKGLVNFQDYQALQHAQNTFAFVPQACSWSEVGRFGAHTFTFVGPDGPAPTMYAALYLDACGSPPRVGIFPSVLAFENWTRDDGENEDYEDWLSLGYSLLFQFGQSIPNYDGSYFQFPLTDGEAEIVNQTIPVKAGNNATGQSNWSLNGTVKFQLQHTPK